MTGDADPWATTAARLDAFDQLHATGALVELPCMACGYPTQTERGGHHVCVVCHWEDDGTTREEADRMSAANDGLTLRQAVAHIAHTGVSASQWHVLSAPEYFLPAVRAARGELVDAFERLGVDPSDAAARAHVHAGRAKLMRAIVTEMR